MRTYSTSYVASFAALAASMGFGTAWAVKDGSPSPLTIESKAVPPFLPEAPVAQPIVQRIQHAVVRATRGVPTSFEDALNRALAAHRDDPDPEAWNTLMQTLQTDATARMQVMRRLTQEPDAEMRDRLQTLLNGNAAPDVQAFAVRLASSNNITQRREGFGLMASLPHTAESYRLVAQTLEQEQDPSVLSGALLNLMQPGIIEPAESRAMVERVRNLTQHSDPNIRATSLMALLQWNKSGETLTPNVNQGLADSAPQVRQVALDMIISGNIRSEGFKAPLFNILRNANEDPSIRLGSLYALNYFTLSNAEYASYEQLRPEIDRLTQEKKMSEKTAMLPH
ncbi:hypothetical protein FNU76_22910 [Chitinimonas arctica]|uniref:HEAT repeat domain-containing protein n=1 Tax=Chitinimonas arctica TaxID=2594795 RepID=A0A516SLQ5_9NEIS|nr:hypothetical protein [Chitinimonas arctica]QDQ28968.1 hypothetical protein FNU76_22910 [Chitinimonas arctica]